MKRTFTDGITLLSVFLCTTCTAPPKPEAPPGAPIAVYESELARARRDLADAAVVLRENAVRDRSMETPFLDRIDALRIRLDGTGSRLSGLRNEERELYDFESLELELTSIRDAAHQLKSEVSARSR